MNISPLAVVDPAAKLGENVTVEPFAIIKKDVVIGDNCHIYPHAIILDGARLGNNCRVFPGAVIAGIPQDLKFKGEITTAEIGDNTTLRECVTVNRGTASKGRTVIGRNCLIMAYSHVAHDCVLKDNVIVGNASQLAGEVEIDDYAIVSGGSLVHQFTRISRTSRPTRSSAATRSPIAASTSSGCAVVASRTSKCFSSRIFTARSTRAA